MQLIIPPATEGIFTALLDYVIDLTLKHRIRSTGVCVFSSITGPMCSYVTFRTAIPLAYTVRTVSLWASFLACSSCDFQRMAVQIKFISRSFMLQERLLLVYWTRTQSKVVLLPKGKLVDHLRSLCVLCTPYVRPTYGLYTAYKLSEVGRGTYLKEITWPARL